MVINILCQNADISVATDNRQITTFENYLNSGYEVKGFLLGADTKKFLEQCSIQHNFGDGPDWDNEGMKK